LMRVVSSASRAVLRASWTLFVVTELIRSGWRPGPILGMRGSGEIVKMGPSRLGAQQTGLSTARCCRSALLRCEHCPLDEVDEPALSEGIPSAVPRDGSRGADLCTKWK
jgi:hypothetical protein